MAHIVNEKGQARQSTALHTVAPVDSETTTPSQPLITIDALQALIIDCAWLDHSAFQLAQSMCPDLLAHPTFVLCRDEASTMFIHLFSCLESGGDRLAA